MTTARERAEAGERGLYTEWQRLDAEVLAFRRDWHLRELRRQYELNSDNIRAMKEPT